MARLRSHLRRADARIRAAGRPDTQPACANPRAVTGRHRQAGKRCKPGDRGCSRQGSRHSGRTTDSRGDRRRPVLARRYRTPIRPAWSTQLHDAGGSQLFTSRRNARHPARHDCPRTGSSLRGASMRQITADAVERLLTNACPPKAVRAIERGEPYQTLWETMESSGFVDALVPEHAGGAGFSLTDASPVLELSGRHAVPLPLAESMLLRALIHSAGAEVPGGPLTFG